MYDSKCEPSVFLGILNREEQQQTVAHFVYQNRAVSASCDEERWPSGLRQQVANL